MQIAKASLVTNVRQAQHDSQAPADAAFLSVGEAAALLRVDRKTIHREIAAGRLSHIRLGRVIRIARAVLLLPRKSA
jgi:excisionase family DNA binding protein